MTLINIILFACTGILLWRLYHTRKIIREVVEAAETEKPVLIERRDTLLEGYKLDRLIVAFNRLITDKASISDAGIGYLAQIRTTLGNLREAVVMVDRSNIIRLANPAFTKLVGQEETPVDRRLDNFIQGEGFHLFLHEIREGKTGQRREIEVQVLNKVRWLEVSAANLEEGLQYEGPLTLFFFHDITRQKGLERMRTEFVANLSHELRTPVTIIRGFAETLLEDDAILSPEEKARFLRKILDNADRQHTLLKDLLLLSRLESTEVILQLEEMSVSGFLKEVSEGWRQVLGKDGRTLECNFEPGHDVVRADPLRMSQMMNNLFENILKHAREFTRVSIGTRLHERNVILYIEDDGAGIPEKDLPHVFQRFYRVEKGRSRELGGTGLGLSIVKHIVGQHGGQIHADSQRGKGTRIEVTLPLLNEPVSIEADRTQGKPAAE